MNLGENIYRLRTERNMSQGDLADALEVSRQSVSKWENNSAVPELEKLIKMSELFVVTLDELVGRQVPAVSRQNANGFSVFTNIPAQKLASAILLICGFMVFLLTSLSKSPLVGLLLAAPFLICCMVCYFCKRNVGVWCIWAVYLYLTFWPLGIIVEAYEIYIPNANDAYIKYALTVQLLALLGTVLLMFQQPITLQKRGKLFLIAGWLIWIAYFIRRVIIYIECKASTGIVFNFNLAYDPGFPLFVLVATITARILYQTNSQMKGHGIKS